MQDKLNIFNENYILKLNPNNTYDIIANTNDNIHKFFSYMCIYLSMLGLVHVYLNDITYR